MISFHLGNPVSLFDFLTIFEFDENLPRQCELGRSDKFQQQI